MTWFMYLFGQESQLFCIWMFIFHEYVFIHDLVLYDVAFQIYLCNLEPLVMLILGPCKGVGSFATLGVMRDGLS